MYYALHVPRSLQKTIGDRAFAVAAAKVWSNNLPRRSRYCRHCTHSSVPWRWNCSADLMAMHITGHSNIDCYVTHTAALQFLLKLVSRWNSWMMKMMMGPWRTWNCEIHFRSKSKMALFDFADIWYVRADCLEITIGYAFTFCHYLSFTIMCKMMRNKEKPLTPASPGFLLYHSDCL